MRKHETDKTVEKINCPKCRHHKAWVLFGEYKRCTKCGFRFTPKQGQKQGKGFFGFFKK